jgi:L-ascorbate metabolism protein UlaG (beta-lactamase superfamily)
VISKAGKSVFFTGDSGYGTHFKNIGNMYKIDAALLPIACYLPRWFMQSRHMNPIEAVQAFLDLNAGHFIPIHWGSFKLSLENIHEPADWLKRISEERGLSDKVHILEQGTSWNSPVA